MPLCVCVCVCGHATDQWQVATPFHTVTPSSPLFPQVTRVRAMGMASGSLAA